MPYFLRYNTMEQQVSLTEANWNLAMYFQQFDNLTDPDQIDSITQKMYNVFHESELQYSEKFHLQHFIMRKDQWMLMEGKNNFSEERHKGKSKFVKDFFEVKRTIY